MTHCTQLLRYPLPTPQRLQELFDYDPLRGELLWKKNRTGTARAGTSAGTCRDGDYVYVKVDDRKLLAHRVIFAVVTGRWPHLIDHINQDKSDNKWTNLREASVSENGHNRSSRGAYFCKRESRWIATITVNKKRIHIGTFETEPAAHAAYLVAKAAALAHIEGKS